MMEPRLEVRRLSRDYLVLKNRGGKGKVVHNFVPHPSLMVGCATI